MEVDLLLSDSTSISNMLLDIGVLVKENDMEEFYQRSSDITNILNVSTALTSTHLSRGVHWNQSRVYLQGFPFRRLPTGLFCHKITHRVFFRVFLSRDYLQGFSFKRLPAGFPFKRLPTWFFFQKITHRVFFSKACPLGFLLQDHFRFFF